MTSQPEPQATPLEQPSRLHQYTIAGAAVTLKCLTSMPQPTFVLAPADPPDAAVAATEPVVWFRNGT